MYRLHTHCRACGYALPKTPPGIKAEGPVEKLVTVFNLGHQPLANAFARPEDPHSPLYPLEVLFCPRCTLAQLSVVVPPETLYRNYKYITSRSDMMLQHFHDLWRELSKDGPITSLIEVGSNDGFFLEFARAHGADRLVGIDPAENLAAKSAGTICDTLNEDSARMAGEEVPVPDVILARHVFCHVDDWRDFVHCLHRMAGDRTRIAIEVPYVGNLLGNCEFDTIYHEHLSYMSLRAMEALLEDSPFCIQRVVDLGIHGGSILIVVTRRSFKKCDPDTAHRIELESITPVEWYDFGQKCSFMQSNLRHFIMEHCPEGVCGFGASAKSTVWINSSYLNGFIRFICDNTPAKQGCRVPGTNIPVVDEGALLRELPKYAVCFAWNFRDEILKKNARYRELGGKFVFPVPKLEVV